MVGHDPVQVRCIGGEWGRAGGVADLGDRGLHERMLLRQFRRFAFAALGEIHPGALRRRAHRGDDRSGVGAQTIVELNVNGGEPGRDVRCRPAVVDYDVGIGERRLPAGSSQAGS